MFLTIINYKDNFYIDPPPLPKGPGPTERKEWGGYKKLKFIKCYYFLFIYYLDNFVMYILITCSSCKEGKKYLEIKTTVRSKTKNDTEN